MIEVLSGKHFSPPNTLAGRVFEGEAARVDFEALWTEASSWSLVLACAVGFALVGCMDADPFSLSSRRIAGKYQLEQFESGAYYLLKDGHEGSGGGYINGIVLEIGWDSATLAVKRYSNYRGDPDGWKIIDLRSDRMTGPYSDEEFRRMYPSLRTYDPEVAWKKL